MAVRYLTSKEKEMITVGLNMRRNYIETGSISLGAADVAKIGVEESKRQFDAEINALSEDQMKLIIATNELERKIYSDKIFVAED